MATVTEPTPDVYVDAATGARVLGPDVTRHNVRQLAKRGLIGTRTIPGVRNRFKLADIERLARDSVRPATATLKAEECP
jgi:hypothetical protein